MYLQSHIYKNIPVSFDFITTWNQGVFLCSPCIWFTGNICSLMLPKNRNHFWTCYTNFCTEKL